LARHHIIISGTGRAGTTFLVQLLTALGLETGFTDPTAALYENCNAGMEWDIRDPDAPYIIKNPLLCDYLDEVLANGQFIIDHAIIPVRDLYSAAESRRSVDKHTDRFLFPDVVPGGLWHTDIPEQQEPVLANQLYRLIYTIGKRDIPLTLLHFPKFLENPDYLYRKIGFLLGKTQYEQFQKAFRQVARPELVHDFYREGERKPPLEGLPNVPENGALTRDLYLDLLINTLANTIYQDRSIDPSNAGSFQPGLRAEGRDWPAVAHTMIGVQRLKNVQELAQRVINEGVPGDFVEAGVWRGGCCILMRGILEAYGIADRKVYAIDSFAGLPPPNPQSFPQDSGFELHLHSELAVPIEKVKANFARYGLLDDQVMFVKGLFQDTLPSLKAGPFALLRLDADTYEATHIALRELYPRLSPGGFVIVDDYGAYEPCRMAVSDYRSLMDIDAPIHEIDWTGVWWQK